MKWFDRFQKVVTYSLIAIVNIPSILLLVSGASLQSFLIDNYLVVLNGNYLCVLLIFISVFVRAIFFLRLSKQMGKLFLGGILFSFLGITYSAMVDYGIVSDFLFNDNAFSVLLGFFIEFCFLTAAMAVMLKRSLLTRINLKEDVRYRELHHRIKNNLQVVSSLMNLQAIHFGDSSIKQIVEDGQKRIQVIALIHQKIYTQKDVTVLNTKDYLEALLDEVSQFYNQERMVKVKLDIQNLYFDVETMTSIGMIVNELVINSYKYAFKGVSDPQISIGFHQSGKDCILQIKDNGNGILGDFKLDKARSFGLRLVNMLTRQLKAQIRIDHQHGMEYNVVFSR